jgi:hypothetical protein
MGRTEFPDLQLIERELWLDTALIQIERNGALFGVHGSVRLERLDTADIVRDA